MNARRVRIESKKPTPKENIFYAFKLCYFTLVNFYRSMSFIYFSKICFVDLDFG